MGAEYLYDHCSNLNTQHIMLIKVYLEQIGVKTYKELRRVGNDEQDNRQPKAM